MCRPSIVRLACVGAFAGYATVFTSQLQAQPAPTAPPQAAPAPSPNWQQLPRMQLDRQFAGPLQDTIVQRWRDPTDGTICYIYFADHGAAFGADGVGLRPVRLEHHRQH
jgi:hypothetical protein